ncbi:electron transporter RsxE [Marinitoga sp. 1135]|uniref:Ion-translocating oxidoreductase complex subunit E n=1 Tax=Marinitoga piezophila (strain DSM 14283 / JCM 11233 / KA3) TaxID=443254 RepID=H2J599_MARPK|nr:MULTISPECIES: electron transport complex subunit E [Marinitoga]AEX84957.1 electron transport complex, RnfABCDGE type, E subunit [Marinitoga piezophila KA3]APT75464.1 electron transporter RsxE [Marinitoga sp. 1137]NUU95189.1 electron transporter RsxE [Marinitoga sp. 1135]NUU97121.1 electron transporter RsxE [Marinitoga sp. 1138]
MADIKNFKAGLVQQNPVFVQVLGMCPTLATTTNAENALGMGLATLSVLTLSNIVISIIKKWVPKNIRIPIYIVVIASFVTMVDLLMHGYTYDLWKTLGLFIPLIVVNCIILGRAESFASKNSILDSIYDALGMGLGFTGALVLLGSVRELLGNGTIFGFPIWGDAMKLYVMILPPGAFLVLGMLLAMFNAIAINNRKKAKAGDKK